MDKIRAQSNDASSGSSAHSMQLPMHRDSHTISKLKSKVRIIQIVSPQIIKTNVENFRDLVQRLTGKPAEVKGLAKKARRIPTNGIASSTTHTNCPNLWKKFQSRDHQGNHEFLQVKQRMKEEIEYLYRESDGNSRGMFGFGEKGINFVQDPREFPQLPFDRSYQSQVKNTMHACSTSRQ